MRKIAPSGIRFIDPAPAVARRLEDVLATLGALPGGGPSVELLASGPSDTLEKLFTTI